jgi:mTERF domain-containing protein
MFKHALSVISPERIDAKLDFLKKVLGCSDNELGIAVRKLTKILSMSDGRLNHTVEFLKMEVGLKAEYIMHRPALFTYSIKRRLIPRHYVLKVLKEKGLVKKDLDFFLLRFLESRRYLSRGLLNLTRIVFQGLQMAMLLLMQSNNKKVPSEFQP